jgi:hypothetical protein
MGHLAEHAGPESVYQLAYVLHFIYSFYQKKTWS